MNCWICDQNNWHLFEKAFVGWNEYPMGICKNCGAVAHQIEPDFENRLKEYYKKEYRGPIGIGNLQTTSRKLNYIKIFLKDYLTEKEKEGNKLIVGDVGCATGYIVDWFRQRGHKATGSEWTINMRRFAYNFYGIPVTEELEPSHKYDLIIMNHTLEHFMEPDKKLKRYRDYLADDGIIYISVPEWLDVIEESGTGQVTSFKNLFHKDHINVFTKNSMKNLFNKVGLEIIKEDYITYGQTYLVKKCEPKEIVKDDWNKIKTDIELIKKAIDIYLEGLPPMRKETAFGEAIKIWPKFPDAYFHWIMNSIQRKDRGRCAELIQEATDLMPGNVKIITCRGYFLYQNENWAGALDDFNYLIDKKIHEDTIMHKGYCLHHMGRLIEAMKAFNDAWQLNPEKYTEAMVWICRCATELKSWDEIAIEQAKEKLFKDANLQIKPNDPVFKP